MATMKQIKHIMMQSKSKVGTRNVRVKIERVIRGEVISVEFNGKPLIDAVSKASESVDRLSQGFKGLAASVAASHVPGLQYALDAMMKEQAAQIEGEKLLAEFGTRTVPDQKPLTYENLPEMRQKIKESTEIQDEVNHFHNINDKYGNMFNVDRQDLIDDDVPSLAMQRLTRYEPVRKPVVMFDELHDHQWHTESGFKDEYVEQCKICGVKKDEN